MPEGSRVHRCADKLEAEGKPKSSAIAICTASTNESYKTGRRIKGFKAPKIKSYGSRIRRKGLCNCKECSCASQE